MHSGGLGKTPKERSEQVMKNESSVHRYEDYVPVDKANDKLRKWASQGAEIVYLSSHRNARDIKKDIAVLTKYKFPKGPVLYRHFLESYARLAERTEPDILIEDDCKSIGGEIEMTYPHIKPAIKKLIRSIVVKEFSGMDNLPDSLIELAK